MLMQFIRIKQEQYGLEQMQVFHVIIPGSDKKPVIYNKANNSIFEDIRFFREDKDGNLWIGANEGGVIMYNMKTSKFEAQPYINSILYRGGQVKALEIDKQNNLWIGTVEGVAVGTINEAKFSEVYSYG